MAGPKAITAVIEVKNLADAELKKLMATITSVVTHSSQIGKELGGATSGAVNHLNAELRNTETAMKALDASAHRLSTDFAAASQQAAKLFNHHGPLKSNLDSVKVSLQGIEKNAQAATQATTRLGDMLGRIRGLGTILGPAMMGAAGHAVDKGLHYDKLKFSMRAAGMSDEEVKHAEDEVEKLTKHYPTINKAEALHDYKEVRSVVADPHHADEAFEVVQKARAVLKAAGDEEGAAGVTKYIKAAESLGRANTKEDLIRFIDAQVKGRLVMGGTVSPEDVFSAAQHYKNSGAALSDRFLSTTGLSLAQEMGGSTAATAVRMLNSGLVGGHLTHAGFKNLADAGFVNKDDIVYTKATHEAKGYRAAEFNKDGSVKRAAGGVVEQELLKHDPDLWIRRRNAEFAQRGMNQDQIENFWTKTLNASAADFAIKVSRQEKAFAYHAELYGKAKGTEAADDIIKTASGKADAAKTTAENVSITAASVTLETANTAINGANDKTGGKLGDIGNALVGLPGWMRENPLTTSIASTAFGAYALKKTFDFFTGLFGSGAPQAAGTAANAAEAATAAVAGTGTGEAVAGGTAAATTAAGTAAAATGGAPAAVVGGVTLSGLAASIGLATADLNRIAAQTGKREWSLGRVVDLLVNGSDTYDQSEAKAELDRRIKARAAGEDPTKLMKPSDMTTGWWWRTPTGGIETMKYGPFSLQAEEERRRRAHLDEMRSRKDDDLDPDAGQPHQWGRLAGRPDYRMHRSMPAGVPPLPIYATPAGPQEPVKVESTVHGEAELHQQIEVSVGLDGPTRARLDRAIRMPLDTGNQGTAPGSTLKSSGFDDRHF